MRNENLLPTSFSSILTSTSLPSSILAAAISSGCKHDTAESHMLHIDHARYYGDSYCSLNGKEFIDKFNQMHEENTQQVDDAKQDDNTQQQDENNKQDDNTKQHDNIQQQENTQKEDIKQDDNTQQENTQKENSILPIGENETPHPISYTSPYRVDEQNDIYMSDDFQKSLEQNDFRLRSYSIDLHSKFLFSNGEMVKLLIKSGVGRYLEFKCVDAVLMRFGTNEWQKVPCSKGEIFKSTIVNLKEKRYLTQFMKMCMGSFEEMQNDNQLSLISKEDQQIPFVEFLRKKYHFSDKLVAMICYAIALMDHEDRSVKTVDGLKRVQTYVQSLGIYGPTAFLYPLYGISELSQAFCRVGAVYGGFYVLDRSVQKLISEEDRVVSLCSEGQKLTCSDVVLDFGYVPSSSDNDLIQRCVCVTRNPILDPLPYKNTSNPRQMYHPHQGILLMIIPPGTYGEKQTHTISIVQMDWTSRVCPKDEYLITFQTKGKEKEILRKCVLDIIPESIDSSKTNDDNPPQEEKETIQQKSESSTNEQTPDSSTQDSTCLKKDNIILRVFYSYEMRNPKDSPFVHHPNVHLFDTSISSELHLENESEQARAVFEKMFGSEQEFMKKIPNPEESIYDENAKLLLDL